MSETRLYLYRKAGREVWDAEMWLPDGRRRVWRTGIADRAIAEAAAHARLDALLAPGEDAAANMRSACDAPAEGCLTAACVQEEAFAQPSSQAPQVPSAPSSAHESKPTEEAPAVLQIDVPSWTTRFDRWFFGDLKTIFS